MKSKAHIPLTIYSRIIYYTYRFVTAMFKCVESVECLSVSFLSLVPVIDLVSLSLFGVWKLWTLQLEGPIVPVLLQVVSSSPGARVAMDV